MFVVNPFVVRTGVIRHAPVYFLWMNMLQRITIPVEIVPDVTFLREDKDGKSFHFCAVILSHHMMMMQECDATGISKSYHSPKYIGCRLQNERIEILSERHGWRVDEQATKLYAEKEAEKELLK